MPAGSVRIGIETVPLNAPADCQTALPSTLGNVSFLMVIPAGMRTEDPHVGRSA